MNFLMIAIAMATTSQAGFECNGGACVRLPGVQANGGAGLSLGLNLPFRRQFNANASVNSDGLAQTAGGYSYQYQQYPVTVPTQTSGFVTSAPQVVTSYEVGSTPTYSSRTYYELSTTPIQQLGGQQTTYQPPIPISVYSPSPQAALAVPSKFQSAPLIENKGDSTFNLETQQKINELERRVGSVEAAATQHSANIQELAKAANQQTADIKALATATGQLLNATKTLAENQTKVPVKEPLKPIPLEEITLPKLSDSESEPKDLTPLTPPSLK